MRCSKAQKLLSVRLDGELDEPRERRLQAHLVSCDRCRAFAQDLTRCGQLLDALVIPEPRPGFAARLTARLSEWPAGRQGLRDRIGRFRPVRVAAAVIALACGAGLAHMMNGTPGVPPADRVESEEVSYAESFEALPDESPGALYLALLERGGD